MGYRKILSVLITIVMVVTSVFSVSLADNTETDKTCTTESGITLTIPKEFGNVLWPGIDEDDPYLKEIGINKRQVLGMYNQGGVELQCSRDANDTDSVIFVIIFERNAPSNLNAEFTKDIQPMTPSSFGTTDAFGYGMVEKAGVPLYKISYQTHGDTVLRLNQYSLITGSGKWHQINVMLMRNPEEKNIATFSDEECKLLEETTESIISSIKN